MTNRIITPEKMFSDTGQMLEDAFALRLADSLEQDYCSCHEGFKIRNRIDPQCESCQTKDWRNEAAAELRRLHAENQELREEVAELRAWLEVETERVKQVVAAEHQTRQKVINGLKLLHDSLSMASKENKV